MTKLTDNQKHALSLHSRAIDLSANGFNMEAIRICNDAANYCAEEFGLSSHEHACMEITLGLLNARVLNYDKSIDLYNHATEILRHHPLYSRSPFLYSVMMELAYIHTLKGDYASSKESLKDIAVLYTDTDEEAALGHEIIEGSSNDVLDKFFSVRVGTAVISSAETVENNAVN